MRDLTLHRCAKCGKHREGKLHKFEGRWYCVEHWRDLLTWHETKSNLTMALQTGAVCGVSVTEPRAPLDVAGIRSRAYQASDRAAFALRYNRPREFVRAFIDAMWAWEELR